MSVSSRIACLWFSTPTTSLPLSPKTPLSFESAIATLPRVSVTTQSLTVDSPSPREMVLELAEAFSPRIEAGDDCFYLDLSGQTNEDEWLERLRLQAAKRGLTLGVGIASNKLIARLSARQGVSAPIQIKAGDEARFVAPMPLKALRPSSELTETLMRWGLQTLGEVAKLPSKKMIITLGKEGWLFHQASRGIDRSPFLPITRAPVFLEKAEWDWEINEMEPLLFYVRPLLERLTNRLRRMGMACQRLEITLRLEPRGESKRSVRLRSPSDEEKTLLRVLQSQLVGHPPNAPVTGIQLLAHPDQPRPAQLSLFGPPTASPAQLATTLAQLAALFGDDRVGSPQIVDGHRPERESLADYRPPPAPLFAESVAAQPALTAIRVLRPSVSVFVKSAKAWPWQPVQVQSAKPGAWALHGPVRACAGPWRVEEKWWSPDGILREYWEVGLADGALYRMYQDQKTKAWWVDGVYD